MDVKADDLLRSYALASLQQMARDHGLEFKKKNKEQMVQELAPLIFTPEAIRASLEDLSPTERLVLDRIILAGADTPTDLVRLQLERDGKIDRQAKPNPNSYWYYEPAKGSARNRGSRKFSDLVARLGALALVFTAEPLRSSGSIVEITQPGRRLFIPDAILKQLPPVRFPVETTSPPEKVVATDPAPLLRDFYLLLSFAAREPIPLSARGMILKRSLTRIDSTLRHSEWTNETRSEDDLAWLPFLRAMAEQLGLLSAGPGELVLDGTATEAFLRRPAGERQQRLFDAYRQTARWNELFRIPDLSLKGKGMSIRTAAPGIIAARQRVLTELAGMPAGEWIALEHVIHRLRVRAYEFLLSRRMSPDSYYYGYYGYGQSTLPNPYPNNPLGLAFQVDGEEEGWDLVEAEFIREIIEESLYWLGVVDLGGTEVGPTAFRITADGVRLLHGEALPARPSLPQVIVQPNFQIIVLEPTGEDILFRLDQLADRLRADQAIEYELTRDSVYRAQRAGLDAAAIVEFLGTVSTVELPQNVRRTIEEWGAQVERVTVRRRTPLLQTRDQETLDGLYADSELAKLLGRRLAPTVALVKSGTLQPLVERLERRKLLPALTEGPDDQSAPLLAADSDGRLVFRQHLPSIYELHPLRAFGEVEDGAVRLSRESLRRGAKTGLSADDIVATLERLHAGPLPAEITALVRKWAKNWGEGTMTEATILQVEQPETLADLLADPELRPSLLPVPGAPKLVLVRPKAVKRVRALLNDRGMVLHDRLID